MITRRRGKYVLFTVVSLFFASCGHAPFANKSSSPDSDKKTAKAESAQKKQETEPKPGDIRVVDGVEYVYAKNRRYMSTPYEPEYMWIRKDQYSPGLVDSLRAKAPGPTKEEKEMEARITKVEEALKKKEVPSPVNPQSAPTSQPLSIGPAAVAAKTSFPAPAFSYPPLKIRRHVLVLPITGFTDSVSKQFAEHITNRLVARLESTGLIVCLDPGTVDFRGDIAQPKAMKELDELYGIQAIVKGALSDGSAAAAAKLSLFIYNTETGLVIKRLESNAARLPGDADERTDVQAGRIDAVADEILKSLLSLDWHARIASTEQGKIFITAGKLSGLEKGDILEVYAPGDEVMDAITRMPLGKLKGQYKGEIEIMELFGVDAALVKARRGDQFSTADLVYLKR